LHTSFRYFQHQSVGAARPLMVDVQMFEVIGDAEAVGLLHAEQVAHLARHTGIDVDDFLECAQSG
jgi:hypothetical protein